MNLGKMIEFLEKKTLFLGIILILALGGYFVFQKLYPTLTRPSQKLPEPQFYSRTSAPTTTLGAILPREKSLPVFLFKEKSLTRNRIWSLARSFGFTGEPKTSQDARWGTVYRWSEGGKTLTAHADGKYFSFSYDFSAEAVTTFGDLPTPEESKNLIWEFLEKEGLDSSLLNPATEETRALKLTGARPSVTSLDQADVLEIHFQSRVENYPLLAEEGSTANPVVAWIDRGGKILKLDWHSLGEIGEKVDDYPLKSSTEIGEDLEAGKATLVRSEAETTETLEAAMVSKISLAYLAFQRYLQPVFVLEGQAGLTSGERAKVTLYLPAISDEFFEAD